MKQFVILIINLYDYLSIYALVNETPSANRNIDNHYGPGKCLPSCNKENYMILK